MANNNTFKHRILFIENSVSHIAPGGSHKSLINLYDSLDFEVYEPFILLNEKNEILANLLGGRDAQYLNHQTLDTQPSSKAGFYQNTHNKSRNKNSIFKKVRVNLVLFIEFFEILSR